jgi:SAM-dependent methyltransferase
MTLPDEIPLHDFQLFLHELRTRRLALMPAGATVVLSGGSAGQWYFDWFAEHYRSRVERHIGVEYFSPPPDPLPNGVEWLARTLGDLSPITDGEVDLVFAGQVIEHLWPADVAGFLCEANRVLRPDGVVVIDSPTRFVTAALEWTQPEHTIEFEVEEITELLELAGFVDVDIKGIWLCYDRTQARVIPLDIHGGGDDWPWRRRVDEADARPQDSFIWWAEAKKGASPAKVVAVRRRVDEIYDQARPSYFDRMKSEFGPAEADSAGRFLTAGADSTGCYFEGPRSRCHQVITWPSSACARSQATRRWARTCLWPRWLRQEMAAIRSPSCS